MKNRMSILIIFIVCLGGINITVHSADPRLSPAVNPVQRLPNISQPAVKTKTIENVAVARWAGYKEGAKHAVRTQLPLWVQNARFANGTINGSAITGGKLISPIDILQLVKTDMIVQGIPDTIAGGFMGPLIDAWNSWGESIQLPGLPWYPSFEVFPGPFAPPRANTPHPLVALPQNPTFLMPSILSASIKTRLAAEASSPEATEAINDFCQWFYNGFNIWRSSALISDVFGTGSVPTFSPPFVNVGPVVNGTISGCKILPLPNWP